MKVALFGSGARAKVVLQALLCAGVNVPICVYSGDRNDDPFAGLAIAKGLTVLGPENLGNDPRFLAELRERSPDILLSVAYHHLLNLDVLECFGECINFHAGDLTRFRGCSPMNWALADGEATFTISALRMDMGIDSGDVIKEKTFEISVNETISELHEIAAFTFAEFALDIVSKIQGDSLTTTPSPSPLEVHRYCSRRFPDDALVLWDKMSAWEVHNLIRASSLPYGGAISFLYGYEVRLWKSLWTPEIEIKTAPGRVCRISKDGIYVGAQDQALLLTEVEFSDQNTNLLSTVKLYDKFQTMSDFLLSHMRQSQ